MSRNVVRRAHIRTQTAARVEAQATRLEMAGIGDRRKLNSREKSGSDRMKFPSRDRSTAQSLRMTNSEFIDMNLLSDTTFPHSSETPNSPHWKSNGTRVSECPFT
jgi:hypothetical protein